VTTDALKNSIDETLVEIVLQRVRSELKISELRTKSHEAEIAQLKSALDERDARIAQLMKALFGPTSERRSWASLTPDDQLLLEGMGLELPDNPPPPSQPPKGDKKERPKSAPRSKNKARYGPGATVVDIVLPVPGTEDIPPDQLELIESKITEKIFRLDSPYCVLRVHQNVYRKKDGCLEEFHPAPLDEVIPGSIFDVSALAGMILDKYNLHMPIHRQHQALKNADIYLDRGNMIRVLHRVGGLLQPLGAALKLSVQSSALLTVDETPTPVGRAKGKTGKGYFWVFFGDKKEVYFHFSCSRARKVLDHELSGFKGKLLCDGYAAYESFVAITNGNTLCQCWSHTRREFLKAEKREPERVKWILRQIKAMYAVDEKTRGKPPEEVLAVRQSETKPLVDELFAFLKKTIAEETFVPSDTFLKAAGYAMTREAALRVFLDDPSVPLDTNHLERELRGHAVGRKNWTFHVTEEGAAHAAVFYSLIRTCLLWDVNPMTYLVDVLQRIVADPSQDMSQLLPRKWKERFEEAPLRSPFYEALHLPKLLAGRS
jgi:transposase